MKYVRQSPNSVGSRFCVVVVVIGVHVAHRDASYHNNHNNNHHNVRASVCVMHALQHGSTRTQTTKRSILINITAILHDKLIVTVVAVRTHSIHSSSSSMQWKERPTPE